MNIYQDQILDHYHHPLNTKPIDKPDATSSGGNLSCGDTCDLAVTYDKTDKVKAVSIQTKGCAISVASASMLSEHIKGMSQSDLRKMDLSVILNLLGIELSPMRMKCAEVPLQVLKKALDARQK